MFPSNRSNQYLDFDYSDETFPKDLPFVQEYSNDYDHMVAYNSFADQNQYRTSLANNNSSATTSTVVFDFKNPTGAGSWPNQPELDLPAVVGGMEININNDVDGGVKQKKVIHKETERQRRQEMTKLHSSLRELLPLEYIKGKRSVADHMSEAVNYISHLENRIKELGNKKEKMIKGAAGGRSLNVAIVNPSYSGVEVLISCDQSTGDHEVLLSKVMEALVEEGHDIVSCVSVLVDHQLLHNIKSQVNDPSAIDLFMLQQKLSYVINRN